MSSTSLSLEELVARIRRTPMDPALVTPATSLLSEKLANSSNEIDPAFDEAAWNQEWDQIEAAIKRAEQAETEKTLREL
jgi:hypothetical protein